MKRIISLALVLVMAMAVLTACGVELQAPSGVYASESGTYKLEVKDYNADENTGTMAITFTIVDTPTVVSGTFSMAVNDPDAGTFFIDFTPDGGELIEGLAIYDPAQNVIGQIVDIEGIGGNQIAYYPYTGEEAAE